MSGLHTAGKLKQHVYKRRQKQKAKGKRKGARTQARKA